MKLHLGCANSRIPGYYHIDFTPRPHVDYVGNIGRLPFLKDYSVSYIYCSHALQYFSYKEVPFVLTEWFRILKLGGKLRLSVPDFRKMMLVYEKSGYLVETVTGPILGLWEISQNEFIQHKIIFDHRLLTRFLAEAGFCNIRDWDWRTTEHAHIDDFSQAYYPHMDKEHGIMISLNLECDKP